MNRDLSEGARGMVAACLNPKALLPGQDLCHPGDRADCLWILHKGIAPGPENPDPDTPNYDYVALSQGRSQFEL